MKTNLLAYTTSFVSLCMVSCQTVDFDSLNINGSAESEEISTLSVAAEAAKSTGEISWPVTVYVFNNSDECVATQTLADEDSEADFSLNVGTYKLYAVGGANATTYDIPSKENATLTSAFTLKDGQDNHADLMSAEAKNVELTAGETTTKTLTMKRKVAKLTKVSVKNVPETIDKVEVTFTPLYSALNVDGTFTNIATTSKMVSLSKVDASTWTNECNLYVLPTDDSTAIKYDFYAGTSKKSFTQKTNKLTANHKTSIEATYQNQNATLSCVLNGVQWDEDVAITFDIDELNMSDETTNSGNSDDNKEDTPIGTIAYDYEAASGSEIPTLGKELKSYVYVVRIQKDADYTYATIFNSFSENVKGITKENLTEQAEISSTLQAKLKAQKAVGPVSTWRLPTEAEVKYCAENYNNLKQTIGSPLISYNKTDYCCYYLKPNGEIGVYSLIGDKENTMQTKSNYDWLIGFSVVRYKNE